MYCFKCSQGVVCRITIDGTQRAMPLACMHGMAWHINLLEHQPYMCPWAAVRPATQCTEGRTSVVRRLTADQHCCPATTTPLQTNLLQVGHGEAVRLVHVAQRVALRMGA